MRRLIPHPGLSALLTLFWLLTANSFSMGALVVAIVIGIALPIFTAPFWPSRPKVNFIAGAAYLALVMWDIIVANFQIAAIILFRRSADLRPAWLVIPMELATPEAITVLAGTISLTPGTVSSDVSACGRYLLVHALDAADPAAEIARIKSRYESRLQRVFP
jgi:multicomponent K+:H+ antiporter subunit E